MSILLDDNTRVLVQGITGSEGSFHTKRNLSYGTKVVAGVTPGKGGQKWEDQVPALDMARVYPYVRARGAVLIGPNCPGLISPGKANMGIIPGEITGPGPIGLVSRSGTLTYQVMYEMFTRGVGQSTCIGIGGDPIVGSNFIDILGRFGEDPDTQAVVVIGEIGGDEEERAA